MTADERKKLRELLAEATPAPWRSEPAWNNGGCPTDDFYIPGHNKDATVEMMRADAMLIVAMRAALPGLLDELDVNDEALKAMDILAEEIGRLTNVIGYARARLSKDDQAALDVMLRTPE